MSSVDPSVKIAPAGIDRSNPGAAHRHLLVVALFFAAVHLGLSVLDAYRTEVFLRADRSVMRLNNINHFLATEGWADARAYLGSHGVVGDYVPHALLYAIGGRPSIILCQILLLFASGYAIVRLAGLLRLTPRAQAIAMALYFVLPQSLVFPHQLATEALSDPLLVLSTWLFCEFVQAGRLRLLLGGAMLLGLATLIRPITLLWPVAVLLIAMWHGRRRSGVVFCAVAYAPVLLWMTFMWQQTGVFGLGESNHSMARNLYLRVESIAGTMPKAQAAGLASRYLNRSEDGRMGVVEYFDAAAHYPWPFIADFARDAAVFFGKAGTERLTGDYFGSDAQFAAMTDRQTGWRTHIDPGSPLASLSYLWRAMGATLLISLAASGLLVVVIAFAVYGAIASARGLRDLPRDAAARLAASLLIILPVYIFIFSLVVVTVQSRQRAPAEFALAILATYGGQRWLARAGRMRHAGSGGRVSPL